MKSLVLMVFSVFLIAACSKENVLPHDGSETMDEGIYETKAPSKGEIACSITDGKKETAAGTRCGTPTGTCGKATACKAVSVSVNADLPDGMTEDEFISIWNNDETRYVLEDAGYFAVDVERD